MIATQRIVTGTLTLGLTALAGGLGLAYMASQPCRMDVAPEVTMERAPCHKRATVERSPELRVEQVEFGMFIPDEQGEPSFVATDSLVKRPGYGYGWRAKIDTTRPRLTMRERLSLPEAPQVWGINERVELSADRREATTTMLVTPRHGWVYNAWWFTEGDPAGEYTIDVSLDGQQILTRTVQVR